MGIILKHSGSEDECSKDEIQINQEVSTENSYASCNEDEFESPRYNLRDATSRKRPLKFEDYYLSF